MGGQGVLVGVRWANGSSFLSVLMVLPCISSVDSVLEVSDESVTAEAQIFGLRKKGVIKDANSTTKNSTTDMIRVVLSIMSIIFV
ncbi:hypothetical protein JCM15908A_01130 [Prevotella dentasini JCM 15908]